MKYRKFGSLEWEVSILGLGLKKLPIAENCPTCIDETASIELIRYAIDRGIAYLDLSYPCHMEQHERLACVVREALQDGYLEKVKIAVTIPSHLIRSKADFEFHFDRELKWLRTEKADFCLLGRLNRENWPLLQDRGVLSWIDAAMKDGLIESIGFSFHDHFQVFKRILESFDKWSFCQIQFSYMDIDHDPGVSGIKYAAQKGLAVVVAEPLKSGRLAKKPPESVSKIWAGPQEECGYLEWGLRFVWNYPEVTTLIRDMTSIDEVARSASIAESAKPDCLTVQEEVLLSRIREAYLKLRVIPCASCRPCMPCPEGIDVPRIFEVYNDAFIYGDMKTARSIYRDEGHQADRCTECRVCEDRCTKRLPIVDWLKRASEMG